MSARSTILRATLSLLLATVMAAGCAADEPGVALMLDRTTTTAGPGAVASVDTRAGAATRRWSRPTPRPRADGSYALTLSAEPDGSAPDAELALEDVGFVGGGFSKGRPWVGPGVDIAYTKKTHGQYTVSSRITAREIGLEVWSTGGSWRAIVDGKLVQRTPVPVGRANAYHTLWLRFPDDRTRTVSWELSGGAWVAGVTNGIGASATLPTPAHRQPQVYWIGDSYSRGTGARHPGFDDLLHVVKDRLRVATVTIDALSGTGYVKNNPERGYPSFPARAEAVLRSGRVHPDVVVVAGSINDAHIAAAKARAAAARVFAAVRAAAPTARIVVIPFTTSYPSPRWLRPSIRGVAAAARAAKTSYFDLPAAAADATKSTKGLQGSDGHPTAKGHALYGRLIARYLERHVPSLRTDR